MRLILLAFFIFSLVIAAPAAMQKCIFDNTVAKVNCSRINEVGLYCRYAVSILNESVSVISCSSDFIVCGVDCGIYADCNKTSTYISGPDNSECNRTYEYKCTDECIPFDWACMDSASYRICGDYDSDYCLEWSSRRFCDYSEVCTSRGCIEKASTVNRTLMAFLNSSYFSEIFGNDRINIYLQQENGTVEEYGAVVRYGKLEDYKAGPIANPTVNLYISERILERIVRSNESSREFLGALWSGGWGYTPLGYYQSLRFFLFWLWRYFADLFDSIAGKQHAPTPTIIEYCNGSGYDIYAMGHVMIGRRTYVDACDWRTSELTEYYCADDFRLGRSVVFCPKGCGEGRCKP
ncbi:MAG: hypothetical protein QXP42_01410 [Candidatus Micrarchaeia archaeon]